MDFWERVNQELNHRKENQSFRQLKTTGGKVDFCSNDYLGLARSPELKTLIDTRSLQQNITNGATGSRLLSGNDEATEVLEEKLSAIFNGSALLFNSGYTANLGVLSALPQRNDTIIYDELAHACMKDGARLSLASRFSFRHNDLNDLEAKLKRAKGQAFIAIESIYSMDGDQAPLGDIVSLKNKYQSILVVDEAHSTGVMGKAGSGLACNLGLEKQIDIRIYTFGKAMGVHGACVLAAPQMKDYLINFCRPFIYTTALTPHSIVAIGTAFDFLKDHMNLQEFLKGQIEAFRSLLSSNVKTTNSRSAIQAVLISGNEAAKDLAAKLQESNLDCRAILAPTVNEGSERIRICLHSFNTKTELQQLASLINIYS